ncbi:hypothetical protein [Sessilibacter corallicola]|uniref:Uncharacterized protein n=1 Tax=Sessilibacter corallicola TaxID=2904075 RepID=A0ABQ0AEF0_9GAMM|nr:hypothetical protein [Sessilibacter corallicola]MCE2028333.1 hypothetical protein [Sessilibacter corallicola]
MKLNKTACAVLGLFASSMVDAGITKIEGHVAHGVNFYNGSPIGDYSSVSPTIGQLFENPREIGVLEEDGAADSGVITPETDRSRNVATTRGFLDFFNPGGRVDESLLNVTLDQIGNNFFGFENTDDRIVLPAFPDGPAEPAPSRRKGVNDNPTVGEWEEMSGLVTVKSKRDGTSTVRITIRNAFPNAVYSFWDGGVFNPLSEEESGYVIPLGGVPNFTVTDDNGCAFKEFDLSYDLVRACENGAASCSSFVAGFYHWDGQLYGASPAGTFANAPTGVYAGVQMLWPTSGELLQEPATSFGKPIHGCFAPRKKFFKW